MLRIGNLSLRESAPSLLRNTVFQRRLISAKGGQVADLKTGCYGGYVANFVSKICSLTSEEKVMYIRQA